MPITTTTPLKGRHFPGEVILLCVRWYLRYPLAYQHVSELLLERGVAVDASCIWRWVQAYFEEAVGKASAARSLSPSNIQAITVEAYAFAKLGRTAQAHNALEECLQVRNHRYVSPYCIAPICNGLDRPEEALAWLERAFVERDPWLAFLSRSSPNAMTFGPTHVTSGS
jgi:tetratricopeptide (TPR) repeat protein